MNELGTTRLRLRRWRDGDAPFVLDMCSRWEVQRYIGPAPAVLSHQDEALARLRRWNSFADGTHAVWAVEDRVRGGLLGTLLLVPLMGSGSPLRPTGDTEIGWYFHPDAWGHGYATEAARAVVTYAWDRHVPRVLAVTHPENTASQEVCRRLGMTAKGSTDAYYNMECELFTVDAPLG